MVYNLELNDYEVANLREGLQFLKSCGGDTGDWMGQILNKLPVVDHVPNVSAHEQQRRLALRAGWKLLF